ncbi:prohibitin family protein [Lacihabitans sp. LS3-19]|uniref:prohibitin family protein n=1 Tax=Lacihabitans sp. LS3-19 TaxID=2487335 RepID=UPI0020CDBE62|nr:prohibitin family protein [Lacihabitans sp. LS3-19]MCP9769759.1 prohibitin family protein [Lacihabitans sp. LS3-19]
MIIILIGIVLVFAAYNLRQTNSPLAANSGLIRILGIIVILVGLALKCIVQVDAGKVGVQSLFGNVNKKTLNSGLNFVNPLVDVTEMDLKTQNYTMSGVNDEGTKSGDDAIKVLSADGLEVTIDLTVLFRIIPIEAPNIYKAIGVNYVDVIVRPLSRTRIRDISANYDAVALYSSKRDEFQLKIFNAIEKDFKGRGIVLEQLLVRNITLPESVKKTIESKINAEQDAQKMQFVLQKETQEAERKRVEAQGIADYQRIITSTLTDRQLQYEQIKAQKELAASPNAKIVIMGNGKGSQVLLNTN